MPTHDGIAAGQAPVLESAIPALERLEGLLVATNTPQTSSLRNVVLALGRLERAIGEERLGQAAILHALVADERLQKLEKLARKQRHGFDAIDFVGELALGSGRSLWGPELLHSELLAWILDPNESHGIGERFLKPFLARAGAPRASHEADWPAAEVTREWPNLVGDQWGYLDVLVVNKAQRVLCAIEVKTFSSEHDEQLTRYRVALEEAYPTFTRYYVFLTPWGTKPFDAAERACWTPLTYATVFEIIQSIAENDDEPITTDVRAFLRQYATTLRRNLMPDTSVSQLTRQIWLEHQEAMELLLANRPDWVAETVPMLTEAIARHPQWIPGPHSPKYLRFRSANWDQFEATQAGRGWAPNSNALFLWEFAFGGSPWTRPYLKLVLGRGKRSHRPLRERLFQAVCRSPEIFRTTATSLGDGFVALHEDKDFMLDKSDYGVGLEDGATRAKIEAWVADFATTRFPAMNDVILRCLREYEDDQRISRAD